MGRLSEGEDYYLERGFLVFTEAYLARRGYCCGSGCRHCPYWPRHSRSRVLARDVQEADTQSTNKQQDGRPDRQE